MSGRATAGAHGRLRVVDSDMSPRRDSVARLHRVQGDPTEVQCPAPPRAAAAPAGSVFARLPAVDEDIPPF